jgi:ABC-2 type transport system ATP-binding protein
MATHLLGEIERVCEDLIVIDGGQLVQQGTLASFTTATATLEVEVDGDPAPLATRLRSHGMTVEVQGSRLFVESEGEPPYDLILDATVESGLGLVRMQVRRHSLSDLFRGTDRAAERAAVAERPDA